MKSTRPRSEDKGGTFSGSRAFPVRRREVLAAILVTAGSLAGGCGRFRLAGTESASSKLAGYLGYLLYGDHPPAEALVDLRQFLAGEAKKSLRRRMELEWTHLRIAVKEGDVPLENLDPRERRAAFERIQPKLIEASLPVEACRHHLRGERALLFLDYPDKPGVTGECERLIMEGEIWKRYYPQ